MVRIHSPRPLFLPVLKYLRSKNAAEPTCIASVPTFQPTMVQQLISMPSSTGNATVTYPGGI